MIKEIRPYQGKSKTCERVDTTINNYVMKLAILKSVFPVGTVMLAIAGAFAANVESTATAPPPVTGWASLPGTPACSTAVPCKTEVDPVLCTIMFGGVSHQAFGINAQTGQCTDRLYRRN
jgi:hypothetical protein